MIKEGNKVYGGHIPVLDKGYVRYVDHMGSDLSVVNAARASYEKESEDFNDNDRRLLSYLKRNHEFSPWRHAIVTLEVYAPLMTARQWWKYVVGGEHGYGRDPFLAWNEASRRYVTEEPTFYKPEWRDAPASSKQGSGEVWSTEAQREWNGLLRAHQREGARLYNNAIAAGIAPEQARVFLAAYGMYVRWRWTSSLQGVMHLLDERLDEGAQSEFREYAEAVRDVLTPLYPVALARS